MMVNRESFTRSKIQVAVAPSTVRMSDFMRVKRKPEAAHSSRMPKSSPLPPIQNRASKKT